MKGAIAKAVALLRSGELVAFPTETVYGLGADAENPAALAKVFAVKKRPPDHPLIVHLPGIEHLARWAKDVPDVAFGLARAFWPGPLTLILTRSAIVPDAITGGQATVGLRVPKHPLALELLEAFGSGIAAPSANRYGRISPTTAAHVRDELGDQVALVLDGGACEIGIESTIVDLSRGSPILLRPGAIEPEQIARVCRHDHVLTAALESKAPPRVSGSHAAHYAPTTPLRLVPGERLSDYLDNWHRSGHRCAVLAYSQAAPSVSPYVWRIMPIEPAAYAHDLYSAMRELDELGASVIVVEAPPRDAGWHAVADRLQRAAAGSGREPDDDRP